MARPRTIRQEDVTRALKAAAKAGQEVRRVEIHPTDQKIILIMIENPKYPKETSEPKAHPTTIVL